FRAMVQHNVHQLNELVTKLAKSNAEHPMTCYLQFRLKFMQGDIDGATEMVSKLGGLKYDERSLPLTREDLSGLEINLKYLKPLLSIPPGKPPIEVNMLT